MALVARPVKDIGWYSLRLKDYSLFSLKRSARAHLLPGSPAAPRQFGRPGVGRFSLLWDRARKRAIGRAIPYHVLALNHFHMRFNMRAR